MVVVLLVPLLLLPMTTILIRMMLSAANTHTLHLCLSF